MTPRATIIIVNYNTRDLLRACLQSVQRHGSPYPVVVVDNASTDGSAAMVTQQFPRVRLLCNTRNVGFGAANNRALASVVTEYAMLLNSDAELTSDAIAELVRTLDREPEAAAVGATLIASDGRVQRSVRRFPSPLTALRNSVALSDPLPPAPAPVEYVDAAAMLLRMTAVHAVTGFNERFFLYAEDADLCRRLTDAGWTIWYNPAARIRHRGGGSTMPGSRQDDWWRWMALRTYAERHFSWGAYLAFVPARAGELLRQAIVNSVRAMRRDARAAAAARTAWRHLRWHGGYLRRVHLTATTPPEPARLLSPHHSVGAVVEIAREFLRGQRIPRHRAEVVRLLRELGLLLRSSGRFARTAIARTRRGANAYVRWRVLNDYRPEQLPLLAQMIAALPARPVISIVMPVAGAAPDRVARAVGSVRAQVYPHWELWVIGATAIDGDSRVHVVAVPDDPAAAVTAAAQATAAEWLLLFDAHDLLAPDALAHFARHLAEHPEADLLYCDNDHLSADGRRFAPWFKPDWNATLLLSTMYLAPGLAIRRTRFLEAGGLAAPYGSAAVYDLTLRVSERTSAIAHVPRVLYHAGAEAGTRVDHDAERRVLNAALARRGIAATAEPIAHATANGPALYRLRFSMLGAPRVSVIIPTRNQHRLLARCLRSIEEQTTYRNYEIVIVDDASDDPATCRYLAGVRHRVLRFTDRDGFNFSCLMNRAVAAVDSEYVLLLNDDTEVISRDWLETLLGYAQLPGIGAVGARLLYPDGRVQHAGVLLTSIGIALEALQGLPEWSPGYLGYAMAAREYPAVTGACMLTPRQLFLAQGGFDEVHLRVAYQDVDYCLRLGAAGWRCVFAGSTELLHYEHASREGKVDPEEAAIMRRRWGALLDRGPDYNPNLARRDGRFEIAAVCTWVLPIPPPIRIAVLVDGLGWDEPVQRALGVAVAARQADHVVSVLSGADGPQRSWVQAAGVGVHIEPQLRQDRDAAARDHAHVNHLIGTLRREAVDLVIISTATPLPGLAAARVLQLPAVWCVDERVDWEAQLQRLARRQRLKMLDAIAGVHALVFASDAARRDFPPVVERSRCRVITPVPAFAPSEAAANHATLRDRCGVPREAWLLAADGLPDSDTCGVLMRAIQQLVTSEPDLPLHVLVPEPIRAAWAESPVAPTQLHAVAPDAFAAALPTADAFACLPGRAGFPLVLLRAMAAGIPIVAPRTEGTREALHDEMSALLFPPTDVAALSQRLVRLARDRAGAEQLGRKARATVAYRFLPAFVADELKALLDALRPDFWSRRTMTIDGIRETDP